MGASVGKESIDGQAHPEKCLLSRGSSVIVFALLCHPKRYVCRLGKVLVYRN